MTNKEKASNIDGRIETLLMSLRQALIIALGAIEDFLTMQRSIIPRRKRPKPQERKE